MRRRSSKYPRAFRFFVGVAAMTVWLLFVAVFIKLSYPVSRPVPTLPNATEAQHSTFEKGIEPEHKRIGPFGTTTVEPAEP